MEQIIQFAKDSRLPTTAFLCAAFTLSVIQFFSVRLFEHLDNLAYVRIALSSLACATLVCVAVIVWTFIKWANPDSKPLFIRRLLLVALVGVGAFALLGIMLGLLSLFGSNASGYRTIIHLLGNILGIIPTAYLICLIGSLIRTGELRLKIDASFYISVLALTAGLFVVQYAASYLPEALFATIAQALLTAVSLFILMAYAMSFESRTPIDIEQEIEETFGEGSQLDEALIEELPLEGKQISS